ncbi:MAG: molybdenum cofactor guanylyltransferase [Nostocaceae cyanobacterium]|nr:molybdenum cofactor guanylyltransferase [Nostocaceae cyanobacterium]
MTNDLTAIVLAGGRSSRMGRDKALIPINGVPLLQLVCHVAQGCADTVYVVTPWKERYQGIVPTGCQFIQEIPLSAIPNYSPGPLVGFAQGLTQVQTEWVLLLACDLPRLRLEVLHSWVAELDRADGESIASLTRTAKGWDPLCGFYRRNCLSSLQEYINLGGRSFQGWLNMYPVKEFTLKDKEMLFNCNTPEDLVGLQ